MADQKAKEMEPVETQIVEIMPPDIENLIYVVRNKQVMVDSDLSMLYQVETKALILDKTKAYHVGASLKDAGKKCFGINLIEDAGIVRDILRRLELETEE